MTPLMNFNHKYTHTHMHFYIDGILCHTLVLPFMIFSICYNWCFCCGWLLFFLFLNWSYDFHLPIASGFIWKLICHSSLLNVRRVWCVYMAWFSPINIYITRSIYIENTRHHTLEQCMAVLWFVFHFFCVFLFQFFFIVIPLIIDNFNCMPFFPHTYTRTHSNSNQRNRVSVSVSGFPFSLSLSPITLHTFSLVSFIECMLSGRD